MKNQFNNEYEVVSKTSKPNTKESLTQDLKSLGLKSNCVVLVHTSLSKLGWTVGGAITVIDALLELLTNKGTLVMPTFTSGNTEPSRWQNPPVPPSWWKIIRDSMPPFRSEITPTRSMGIISETFRKYPNVYRSSHPVSSFCAYGKYSKQIIEDHTLKSNLGENSPLSRIYDLDGYVLLLGVSHSMNTSLHLAEYRANFKRKKYQKTGSAILKNQIRKWVVWEELNHNSDDFEMIGNQYEKDIGYKPKKVGLAVSRLLKQKDIVDYGLKWIKLNRNRI
ncbi:MAG: aminoglycoside N(3)-acetyltransferase [Candidatus Lokiarchaeota archaeon]|nr:aminoglycoside N(3)-acetyltransferase [Candidatus Lokiarchaeota archaeon]MBD3201665.1 aminoglycoside N(3)-acetyltransferase [Candidatus Lokiarchaeota archaeon]